MAHKVLSAILNSEPVFVSDLVDPRLLSRLSEDVRENFLEKTVQWENARAWGHSFSFGDKTISLGHRRGDHLSTHPHLYGLTEEQAFRILQYQLEGTLLHELGHALLDAFPSDLFSYTMTAIPKCVRKEGALSTYKGMDPEGISHVDVAHEQFAEAFRYWCHDNPLLRKRFPMWHRLVDQVLESAGFLS